MKTYFNEVHSAIKKLKGAKQPSRFLPESYIGSEYNYYQHYNIRVPKLRALQKQGLSFSNQPIDQQWKIWNYIWQNSKVFELSLMVMHFANQRPVEELFQHRSFLLTWIDRIDNWALSDEFSNLLAKLYEHKPKAFKSLFETWNKSDNPWERRASMVGLLYYSRFRQKYVPYKTIIAMVDPHLLDKHYYVQKAVGWTLRECWNVYPDRTYSYLKKKAHLIPPGGWTAATEKLSKADKALLTQIRKKS